MPLNYPPLGYTGETPVKQNCTVKESIVRAATAAEVATGTRTDIYVAPSTLTSGVALDFASPGTIGSTTPNTGAFTTLTSSGNTTLATGAGATTIGIANVAPSGARTTTINGGNSAQNDTVNILAGLPSAGTQAVNILSGTSTGGTQTVVIGNTAQAANAVSLLAGTTGGLTLSSGGAVKMAPATSSGSSTSFTLSSRVGSATVTGLTTASAASVTFTITNTIVSATSAIFVSVSTLGTNDAELTIQRVNPGTGSFTVICKNNGAAAVNGNVIVNFWVIN